MQRPSARETWPWYLVAVGVTALAATVVAGVYVHFDPGPNPIDHLGFVVIPPEVNSHLFHAVTWFGTFLPLVIGSIAAAVVAWCTGQRDRWRALACLVAPPLAALVNECCIKPVVGRTYFGELSFTSGSVVVVAAVSAAWVLAVPRPWRVVTATVGVLAVAMMVFAVVALQWHYPSDALIGAVFAVGTVVLVDGAVHLLSHRPAGAGRYVRAEHDRVEPARLRHEVRPSLKA